MRLIKVDVWRYFGDISTYYKLFVQRTRFTRKAYSQKCYAREFKPFAKVNNYN